VNVSKVVQVWQAVSLSVWVIRARCRSHLARHSESILSKPKRIFFLSLPNFLRTLLKARFISASQSSRFRRVHWRLNVSMFLIFRSRELPEESLFLRPTVGVVSTESAWSCLIWLLRALIRSSCSALARSYCSSASRLRLRCISLPLRPYRSLSDPAGVRCSASSAETLSSRWRSPSDTFLP